MTIDFAHPLFLRHSTFDDAVSRIQRLAMPLPDSVTSPSSSATISTGGSYPAPSPHKGQCSLDSPFSMSPYFHRSAKVFDDEEEAPTIIDTFSPRPVHYDLSPPSSSASSDFGSASTRTTPSKHILGSDAFFATRSRVVRLYNLPQSAESFLSALFNPQATSDLAVHVPIPASMWELRDEYSVPNCDSVWAVFKTHEEACAALFLSGSAMSVVTALESDLEPFHKLKRFQLCPIAPSPSTSTFTPRPPLDLHHPQMLRASSCHPDFSGAQSLASDAFPSKAGYTLSTNPPNPRTSFRLGDWICNNPQCAAHNFGRNVNCIGCGCPRNERGTMPPNNQQPVPSGTRPVPSPRFNNFVQDNSPLQLSALARQPPSATTSPSVQQQPYSSTSLPQNTVGSKPAHPLLTPSGRAFAHGGRVQNISSDPMNPCIMYWPDNEPFPEQGQIRPNTSVGVAQPPIMNTGNRGPISHQPGDWICKKCNYLNWRRRKVCQTCLPYAEGNGDSISAAVQAERIALLTSVLAQSQRPAGMGAAPPDFARTGAAVRTSGISANLVPAASIGGLVPHPSRSQSMTPPQIQHRRFADVSPPQPLSRTAHRAVHRSQSQYELGDQYAYSELYASQPIYQTSGHRQNSVISASPTESRTSSSVDSVPEPAHLLPSSIFHDHTDTQDQAVLPPSPSLSPSATTSSSTDISTDDYESLLTGTASLTLGSIVQTPSSSSDNIWRLDGEESKSLSAFPLPGQENVLGSTRKSSREQLRTQADTGVAAFNNNVYNIRN